MYKISLGNITMPVKISKKILENKFLGGIKTIIKLLKQPRE